MGADLGRRGGLGAGALALGMVLLASCSSGTTTRQVTTATTAAPVTTTAPVPTTVPPPPPPPAPLTGQPPADPATATRPALSVKVDNAPGALPQTGLDAADIVTEELVEGGLTRLFATFQSQDAADVGPIRSARPVDADLLRQLGGGIFAYSGAADGEIAPVRQRGTAVLLSFDDGVGAFRRDAGRQSPHDVVASTPDLYAAGKAAGAKQVPPPALFSYDAAPASGDPATSVQLVYSRYTVADWTWDPGTHLYQRGQNGAPDQLSDGNQIGAADVVVLSVGIRGTGIYDAAGNEDPFVVVTGTGKVWLFRDGVVRTGTWSRPSSDKPMKLVDDQGQVMTLRPGRSWVELLPHGITPGIS